MTLVQRDDDGRLWVSPVSVKVHMQKVVEAEQLCPEEILILHPCFKTLPSFHLSVQFQTLVGIN